MNDTIIIIEGDFMKQFKTESKKILNMMINSIYTNEEIFLRELISNSSDAIDKLYYLSLTDKDLKVKKDDLKIGISFDSNNKTITITDNGLGMNKEELEENLGTIAKSGSEIFKLENEAKKGIDIIGQFGVGFYSSFMVSKKVEVLSKKYNEDKAYLWSSNGVDGYEVKEAEKENFGTEITLYLKDDEDEHKYSEYLDSYNLQRIITKYSNYISYPIVMDGNTINDMIPIWKKNKKDVKDEDYNNFYKDKYYDFEEPLKVIKTKVEGLSCYDSLLFIPSHAPQDYYTKEFEKGLELYSRGVLITNKCADLLPDYFSFVKGIVDSEDIELNVSRKTLQNNSQVKNIEKSLESKIKKELLELLKEDREKYSKFFKEFGNQIKYGIYSAFGMHNETLKDLLLFNSSIGEETTLEEYKNRISDNDKKIYYASGESISKIKYMPHVENKINEGKEVLFLVDYLDEFVIKTLNKYEDLEFINVLDENIDEKDNKEVNEENKDMLSLMKESINYDVKLSDNIGSHPVCLLSKGDVSLEMEKVFKNAPTNEKVTAQKVLEINTKHEVYNKLLDLYKNDKEGLKNYTKVLYNLSLLINGLTPEDPNELTDLICKIISK